MALAAILHIAILRRSTQRALLMRVQWHDKTMAAGGAGRWEQSLCGGRWAFFRSFRLDLEIRQIDDQALLLALLVEGTEDGDGNR